MTNMKKKLKKVGSDGLMVYFTKEEQEIYGMEENDLIDLDDIQIIKQKKSNKK